MSGLDRLAGRLADAAAAAGVGAAAGLVGTAAMTVSSSTEARLSGRGASTTPAAAAGKVLGVEPSGEAGERRFNTAVHWAYGVGWGAVRGLLGEAGLRGPAAAAVHLGVVWGGEQVVLPATGAGEPVWEYGGPAVATDLLHHTVYAVATGAAYEWLDRRRSR